MSKRIWTHPEISQDDNTNSWRSSGQLRDTKEFRSWLDREFPRGAAEMSNQDELETSRRSFLKLMGSSTALAGFGLAACRRPEAYLVPYTKAPEWVVPGVATYYATSMPRSTGAVPLIVETHEGRPTKLAPNTLHKDQEGTDAFTQASILDLYSTSRSRQVLRKGESVKLNEFEAVLTTLAKDSTSKIGFVFGYDESPTRLRLINELSKKFSFSKFYQYEALTTKDASVLGEGVKLVPNFAHADRILSFDCDFVGNDTQGSNIEFFNRRKPEGKSYQAAPNAASMNRLYMVEAAYSLTGGMADHRLRVAPSVTIAVAAQIAREFGIHTGNIAPLSDEREIQWAKEVAADLKASGAKTAVLAGSRQPKAIKQLALAINLALGNIGAEKGLSAYQTENQGFSDISTLISDMNANVIETLIFLSPSNPAYDAPSDLKFREALSKIKLSIHLGLRRDATAHSCTWHIPGTHYLESWGDSRSNTGVYSVVQPMILPLYPNCVAEIELLLALLSEDGKLQLGEPADTKEQAAALQAVRTTYGKDLSAWKNLLKYGFDTSSTYTTARPSLSASFPTDLANTEIKQTSTDQLDVIFSTDASVFDGRFIDNAWLQEAPDPISKLTWDNAALIAPKTAKELGIYDEIIQLETSYSSVSPDGEGENRKSPMIEISVNGTSLKIPVLVSFGQAENTIIIPLGYGQGFDEEDELGRDTSNASHVGLVGVNRGFNAYPLRDSKTGYFAQGARVTLTSDRYSVALTQEHNAMYGRALAREISTQTLDYKGDFQKQLSKVKKQGNDTHAPENISLYKSEDRSGEPLLSDKLHQWGMTIDLSSCMGCNACLVACQAENNIPVVGKKQVAMGREMHWIRMDRYFATQEYARDKKGNKIKQEDGAYRKNPDWVLDNPAFVPQPVACVQCESAPCETVCPVNATVHTEDGLNAMAYNRCIGTRYCANNCPYKARRFNFFDYNKRNPLIEKNLYRGPLGKRQDKESPHLQRNPNVTVRMRGVMEKCTYCVQRIQNAVIRQKRNPKQQVLLAGEKSPELAVSVENLRIPVDSVKTACQEACPAHAISFGNLLDKQSSEMGRAKAIARNYDLLYYIGTRPRTSYLARVKNPNPKMPDAAFIGQSTIHMA